MSVSTEPFIYTGTWITVQCVPRLPHEKAETYAVHTKEAGGRGVGIYAEGDTAETYAVHTQEGQCIALLKWYRPWRKYALFPMEQTVWEPTCLREIADVLVHCTRTQRRNLAPFPLEVTR